MPTWLIIVLGVIGFIGSGHRRAHRPVVLSGRLLRPPDARPRSPKKDYVAPVMQ